MVCVVRDGHGGEDDDQDEVDDGGEEAADGAPPHGHRQHAVHAEHDELKNKGNVNFFPCSLFGPSPSPHRRRLWLVQKAKACFCSMVLQS